MDALIIHVDGIIRIPFSDCQLEDALGGLVWVQDGVWPTHIGSHPAGVNSQHLEAARPKVILQDFGLHIQGGLGHAVGKLIFTPAISKAACLRRDVDDELLPTSFQQREKLLDDAQWPKGVDLHRLLKLLIGKIQLLQG